MPDVVEMQSEAGAAGALHGALQKGSLATTFTASQGLLLMVAPFLHFFDGFRTSHQIDKIALLDDGDVAALVRDADVAAFRPTPLSPHGRVRVRRRTAEDRRQLRDGAGGEHLPRSARARARHRARVVRRPP